MRELLLELTFDDFEKYQNLPMGVIVVLKDGTLIKENATAKKIFDNSLNVGEDIHKIFVNKKERNRMIEYLEKKQDGYWLTNKTISYNLNNHIKKFSFYTKSFKFENQLLGVLSLMFETNIFHATLELGNALPVGVLEISDESKVTYSNSKAREILNVGNNFELDDKLNSISNYVTLNDIKQISKDLKTHKSSIDVELNIKSGIEYKKTNASIFIVEEEIGKNGNPDLFYKTTAILEDITYHDIIQDSPTAFFTFRMSSGDYIVENCNENFASTFGKTISECRGIKLNTLFNIEEEFEELIKLIKKISNGKTENHTIEIDKSGTPTFLKVFIKQKEKKITAYSGMLLDVTDDLNENLEKWRKSFASVLHTYQAVNNNVVVTTQEILNGHGSSLVHNGKVDKLGLSKRVNELITGFETHFNQFIRNQVNIKSQETLKYFIDQTIKNIINKNFANKELEAYPIALFREQFVLIREKLKLWGLENKIQIKPELNNQISEILRYLRLASLEFLNTDCYKLESEIQAFRLILHSEAFVQTKTKINLRNIIRDAENGLAQYAVKSNLKLNVRTDQDWDPYIYADSNEIYTVAYNLIHNAIKYSWVRPSIWPVDIKIQRLGEDFILVTVENYGSEIPEQDIKSRKLFSFGKRGLTAQDRGKKRPGTGIGLWYCDKIVRQMNGEINVTSIRDFSREGYVATFKNTFKIKIPNYDKNFMD